MVGNINQGGISGDQFRARVLWTYSGTSAIGVYQGKIWPNGIVQGTTYDEFNPKSQDGWTSTTPLRCETGTTELNMDRPGAITEISSWQLPLQISAAARAWQSSNARHTATSSRASKARKLAAG